MRHDGRRPYLEPWRPNSTTKTDWTLHQIAPYIGKMKTDMARSLILGLSQPGDLIIDPFCGSGVVPLEAAGSGRRVVAGDWSPYAVILTDAKLFPPHTLEQAIARFDDAWRLSLRLRSSQDLRMVPRWVRSFFHPGTLKSALALRDACLRLRDTFLLACLLGILHHQRPGFLSYPSSHLVPYLRTRNFPRSVFPMLYEERDVRTRMVAKIHRTFRRLPPRLTAPRRVFLGDARSFPRVPDVQTVITSPPYMNELDYVRDNRLRLWFIGRGLPDGIELPKRERENQFHNLLSTVCGRLGSMIDVGGYFVLVLGEATRGGRPIDTASLAQDLFRALPTLASFRLAGLYYDEIPDIRRGRRECRGTKGETILIYKKRR